MNGSTWQYHTSKYTDNLNDKEDIMTKDDIKLMESASQKIREAINILEWIEFEQSDHIVCMLSNMEDLIDTEIMNEA